MGALPYLYQYGLGGVIFKKPVDPATRFEFKDRWLIRNGAEFIIRDHRTHNEHGLIRPSIPYDAPMLTGYHTCHNLFALVSPSWIESGKRIIIHKAPTEFTSVEP